MVVDGVPDNVVNQLALRFVISMNDEYYIKRTLFDYLMWFCMVSSRFHGEERPAGAAVPLFHAVLHELVTPVSVIDALARDLLEPAAPLDAVQQRRRVERILRASDELRSIVQAAREALGGAGRVTADGAAEAAEAAFAPVASVVAVAAQAGRSLSAGHPLRVDLEPEAGAALCEAHPLGLVLRTLVGNALVHAPPGTPVTISAHRVPQGVALVVADAGPGVPPQRLPHLFEPHDRGDNTLGRPGSGMGLALARELVTGMGGALTAQSAPGQGLAVQAFVPWGPALKRALSASPPEAHRAA
jgi:signal transduction histidine kinase